MKVCSIEIDKKRVIIIVLEKNKNGNYINHTGKFKTIVLDNDSKQEEVINFTSTLHAHFDSLNLDKILILKRNSKGQFSSSPLSFKIEGLIQTYHKVKVELVSPQTISAYYKKHEFPLQETHNYQINALKLAYYLLNI